MIRRRVRTGPPTDVVARSGLPAGERVLAAARDDDGRWLLGTRAHLAVVDAEATAEGQPLVLAWDEVRDAEWDEDATRFRVTEVGRWGLERASYDATMATPPVALLQLVRERVTASILLTRRLPIAHGRGVMITGRRNPAGDRVRWLVEYEPGLDPDDPAVSADVDRAVERLAAEI